MASEKKRKDDPCRLADAAFLCGITLAAIIMMSTPQMAGALLRTKLDRSKIVAIGMVMTAASTVGTALYGIQAKQPSPDVMVAGCVAILVGAALGGAATTANVRLRLLRSDYEQLDAARIRGAVAAPSDGGASANDEAVAEDAALGVAAAEDAALGAAAVAAPSDRSASVNDEAAAEDAALGVAAVAAEDAALGAAAAEAEDAASEAIDAIRDEDMAESMRGVEQIVQCLEKMEQKTKAVCKKRPEGEQRDRCESVIYSQFPKLLHKCVTVASESEKSRNDPVRRSNLLREINKRKEHRENARIARMRRKYDANANALGGL